MHKCVHASASFTKELVREVTDEDVPVTATVCLGKQDGKLTHPHPQYVLHLLYIMIGAADTLTPKTCSVHAVHTRCDYRHTRTKKCSTHAVYTRYDYSHIGTKTCSTRAVHTYTSQEMLKYILDCGYRYSYLNAGALYTLNSGTNVPTAPHLSTRVLQLCVCARMCISV